MRSPRLVRRDLKTHSLLTSASFRDTHKGNHCLEASKIVRCALNNVEATSGKDFAEIDYNINMHVLNLCKELSPLH